MRKNKTVAGDPVGGRHPKHQEVMVRLWKGLEIVEAKDPLRIIVNNEDCKTAVKQDAQQCVYAQACKRLFDSTAVVFLRTIAYVDLPNSKGVRQINRFIITPEVKEQIKRFDRTGEAQPGGFVLRPPNPCQTLDRSREEDADPEMKKKAYERRLRYRKKAAIIGASKRKKISMYVFEGDDIRIGTGMVHFMKKQK